MNLIENKTFDEERALYHITDAEVRHCSFAGPADGESALKESENIAVSDCVFSLRYPFWHTRHFTLEDSTIEETARASLWYAEHGTVRNTKISGVKCLRECQNMVFEKVYANSTEFGWRCTGLKFDDCNITSEYCLYESKNAEIRNLELHGKYSFQYVEDMTIVDSDLDTKDAFWHAKNVTVKNSVIKGAYLGWYSDGLTLIGCHIVSTQPLCYCKNLTLIGCTMENTDLSFERSEVNATVNGTILSVKNPKSGSIIADGYGEIILENSVMETTCDIKTR